MSRRQVILRITNQEKDPNLALSVAAHRAGVEELGVWFEEHTETVRSRLRFVVGLSGYTDYVQLDKASTSV